MANDIRIEIKGDSKGAEEALKRTSDAVEGFTKKWRVGAAALAGIGAAASLALGSAFKAALAERQGINLLDQALKNAGTSYKASQDAIEGVIDAQTRKTNFADDEQREALQRMVALSGDYRKSLERLPLALDVAAGLQIDLSTASTLVGRALAGNTEIFARYGIKLREGATVTEALNALTQKFGGSAEAAADPLKQLKNAVDELNEAIGVALMPALLPLVNFLKDVTIFAKEHPEITKWVAAALGVAAVLGTIGAAILVIGPILAGLKLAILAVGAALMFLMANPVGIAIVGLAALALAGVAVWKNWDEIKEKAIEIWNAIASFFSNVFDRIKGLFESKWGWILPGGPLVKAFLFIKDNWRETWNAITETFERVVGAIIGIKDRLVGAFWGIWGFITTQWDNIWKGVHDTFDRIVGLILGIRDRLVNGFRAIASLIGDPLAAVWSVISGGVDRIIGLINGAIDRLNGAIGAYNNIPILPNIPNIPKINEGLPMPGDSGFIGPMPARRVGQTLGGGVTNNVNFNFDHISVSEARRQIGQVVRDIVSEGGLGDVGLQRA